MMRELELCVFELVNSLLLMVFTIVSKTQCFQMIDSSQFIERNFNSNGINRYTTVLKS